MKMRWVLLVASCLGGAVLVAGAADWPGWRGPERTGISKETGLLKEWPLGGPRLLWQRKDIDFGYSTPAVVGEHIYLLSNKGNEEFVQALAVKDGKQAWASRVGKVGPNRGPQYPGARSTPTVDGEQIYALGSDGDLACLEKASGKITWRKNLRTDFGGRMGQWAYAESPLIDGDVLVCTPGGKDATLVALNKKTGEVIWKSPVPGGDEAAYASVIVAEAAGVKQYVQFLQRGLVGVDAKSGKFLWRYEKTATGSPANIPTPVAHQGLIYSASARAGGGLVQLKADKGGVVAEEVYSSTQLPSSIGGAVLVDGHLYGTNARGLVCVEFATGKQKWQDKCVGAGSLCYADGQLVVFGERNGEVALVEATPAGYKEKGRFTAPDQPKRGKSQAWAYPIVANGRLYLRDLGVLWCYDIKAP